MCGGRGVGENLMWLLLGKVKARAGKVQTRIFQRKRSEKKMNQHLGLLERLLELCKYRISTCVSQMIEDHIFMEGERRGKPKRWSRAQIPFMCAKCRISIAIRLNKIISDYYFAYVGSGETP